MFLQRDEQVLRKAVITAERALLVEIGFFLPDFPLHGEVYRHCVNLSLPMELTQAAWNIANDRHGSTAQWLDCTIARYLCHILWLVHFEFMVCCSFMTTIGLTASCTDAAWAVLLAMAQLFDAEQRLKDDSGQYLWEAEGVSTPMVEGARQKISCTT
jgi:hypothetical protein